MIDSGYMPHLYGFRLPLAILYLERLLELRLHDVKLSDIRSRCADSHLACQFIDAFKYTLLLIRDHFANTRA